MCTLKTFLMNIWFKRKMKNRKPVYYCKKIRTRAAVVHLNFRAGSTFPVPVCTLPGSMDRTSRCNKVDAVRLYASNRLNLLLLKGQRWVRNPDVVSISTLMQNKLVTFKHLGHFIHVRLFTMRLIMNNKIMLYNLQKKR